jgi:N-acetylglucosaminyldiphosphoundecaprenol N-acetyl-beta-D-mannosaminyltransferase
MRRTVAILGVPIDDLNSEEALHRIEEFIASGRFHQVATANTDFLVKAAFDPELRTILRESDLVVPDGMPIVLASHWLRVGLRERVTGSDMVPRLARLAAEKGYRLFMLGARPEVAQRARQRLLEQNPDLQIVGCVSPENSHVVRMDNEAILREIEAARPDILLVAFGNPKQEKWIHMHRHRLKVPVCIGIGATFDFIAGEVRRAPKWMQRAGLEWLFRLLQEPRRMWRRYGADFWHFGRFILVQLWALRGRRHGSKARIAVHRAGETTIISLVGSIGVDLLGQFQSAADQSLNAPTDLVLDLTACDALDSAAIGTLINLSKRAAYVSRRVAMCGGRGSVLRALRVGGVLDVIPHFPCVADSLAAAHGSAHQIDVDLNACPPVVRISGSADGRAISDVRAALTRALDAAPEACVNLEEVEYIDSAMLAALTRTADAARGTGRRLRVVLGSHVAEVLRRERLMDAFELHGTRAAVRER